MATLKILWQEQQDMRRVQVAAANRALAEHDGRVAQPDAADTMRFTDLVDYIWLVFPELEHTVSERSALTLHYRDDDDEQVRITNDAELAEAFRLVRELAAATGRAAPVIKLTLSTTPRHALTSSQAVALQGTTSLLDASETLLVPREGDGDEMAPVSTSEDAPPTEMPELMDELSRLVAQWEIAEGDPTDHDVFKRDLVSLLQEPGCQDMLHEIMGMPKFAALFQLIAMEAQQEGASVSTCLRAVARSARSEIEEICEILLLKCPQARVQVERVLVVVQEVSNVQMLSASDVFEPISAEDTTTDVGPIVAEFLADVTCPDGTILTPAQPFDKVWRIKNGGPTKWPVGCKLLCVGGDRMQAPDSVLIPSVQPGRSIDLSLRMSAPATAGRYTGYWRLSTDDGTRFGQRMWVDVNVVSNADGLETGSGHGSGEVRIPAPTPVEQQYTNAEVVIPTASPVTSEPAVVASQQDEKTEQLPVPLVAQVEQQQEEEEQQSAEQIKWMPHLMALQEMGFTDTDRCIALLEQLDGDLTAVISGLL